MVAISTTSLVTMFIMNLLLAYDSGHFESTISVVRSLEGNHKGTGRDICTVRYS